MGIEEGDRVKLVDTHHAHNDELEKLIGCEGEVNSVVERSGKCLVYFDEDKTSKMIERWWIKPKWLKKL